jgi:diguanylate cyclase (GGDEF)-like protein
MKGWRWIWGWVTVLLAFVATLAPADASPGSAPKVAGKILSVCIAPARPGMTAAALFARPSAFDCTVDQRLLGSGDFWLLSEPLPPIDAGQPMPVVRSISLWRTQVTLHILRADGRIDRTGYTSATIAPHLRVGAISEQALPAGASPPVRLLWHVRGAANMRGVLIEPVLIDREGAMARDASLHTVYAAFFGLAVALLVYNFALWGALRQAFQPAYCLLLLCLIGYGMTSSGVIAEWLPGIDDIDRLRWNGLFLAGSAASVLLFARYFFEPRVFDGPLKRANMIVIAALIGSTTLFAVLAPWHIRLLDRLVTYSYLLLVGIVAWVLVQAWRRRSNYLWIFAITWGAPIVVSSARVAAAIGLIPWGGWIEHSTIAAMATEALLSAIGIAYRIRILSRERDQALKQEAVARVLADIDGLTGLLNRRAFLTHAIGRTGPQTLALADLDHFKAINETIGHDGGDEVLRTVARLLVAAAPPGALVARMGGEEFAVLSDAATSIAPATLLADLRRTPMPFDIAVTTSIGSCTGPLVGEADWQALYRQADRALYAAKAAGRNRACDAAALGVG